MLSKITFITLCLLPLAAAAADDNKPAPEKPNLASILAKYFAAQGGLEYIEGIDSIRMDGTIEQGNKTLPFVQVKKRPNLLRMTIDYGKAELIMGYNGVVAWQTARGREQSIALDAKTRTAFLRSAAMFSQLYQPNDPNVILEYVGEDILDGQATYKIEVTLADGYQMLYYVDAVKYIDLMVVTIEEHEGQTLVMKTKFKDYRKLDKLQLPYVVESYTDEVLTSTVLLEHIRLNPGVFTPYFDPPGGIEGVDEPVTAREVAAEAAAEGEDDASTTTESKKANGRTITATGPKQ